MTNQFKAPISILFLGIVVISIILVYNSMGDFTISKSGTENETTIVIWDIDFLIMNNIHLIPFIILPFVGIIGAIKYIYKSTLKKIIFNYQQPNVMENTSTWKPDFRNKLKGFRITDLIVLLAILIMVPLAFHLIYYYPYKSVYTFNNLTSDELNFTSYYLFPKNTRTLTFPLKSNDSILIHLWDPSAGGMDEPLPAGQVFLYYTETHYINAVDQHTVALIATGLMKNKNLSDVTKKQGLHLKMNDSLEDLSKSLAIESHFATIGNPVIVPQHVQKRTELFTGSQKAAEKLGMLLYNLTGLKTVINHVEGMTTIPSSHKCLPSKK